MQEGKSSLERQGNAGGEAMLRTELAALTKLVEH